MIRRPSGSPIIDPTLEQLPVSAARDLGDGSEGTPARNAQVKEKTRERGGWNRRTKSLDTSPRARASASFNKRLLDSATSADSLDEKMAMLPAPRKSRDGTMTARSPLWVRTRSPWSCSPLTLLTTAVAFLSLYAIIHSALKMQLDPQGCVMSMMSPTYIKLSGFDTEHSRFAAKYSLYLYREEGVDEYTQDDIGLRGTPVLFIPGNAGSYKQVRSLSSEASRYFHGFLKHDRDAMSGGTRNLDFFTVDLNEDLAAFHGQTVIDQAEYVNDAVAYILWLYHDPKRLRRDPQLPDPSSVILIGHSMGGIVARTVLVTPNYQSNSVNTILTMSTPHSRPPVSFDADIVSLYQQINDYWRDSYTQRWASNNPLWHTTLISIAGGGRDTTVPSDYTSLSSLVPESHGFTVFTSTVPEVWTSMDHLAITWADQIRKVIVKSLFDIIDVRRSAQTKPRAERIKVFRKWFLTGLEETAPKALPNVQHEILLTLGDPSRSYISDTSNVTIRRLGAQDQPSAKLLPIPPESSKKRLLLMTDQYMDKKGGFANIEVLFCSSFPLANGHTSAVLPIEIDLSNGSPGATRLACKRAAGDAIELPASTRSSKFAFEQVAPFTFLQYDLEDLKDSQFVAVIDKSTEISNAWLLAEFADIDDITIDADIGLSRLLLRGLNLEIPASRPIMTDIKVSALHSSLLAHTLKIRHQGCGTDEELFTPLLRQHIEAPYESKYFVNFKQGDINLHGVAPFMPPSLNGEDPAQDVAFQIWSDPTCESSLEFQLRVDVAGSLGKLVVRYRTVFAAFPLLVVAMVLRKQFRVYDSTGVFITFSESLNQSLKLAIPILLLSMTILATTGGKGPSPAGRRGSQAAVPSNGTAIDFSQNDLLLGMHDPFFWFLIPLAGLVSVGACVTLNYIVLGLLHIFSFLSAIIARRKPNHTNHQSNIKENKSSAPPFSSTSFVSANPRRRIINATILLLLVATIVPYPFAYLVACLVQLATCTQALRAMTKDPTVLSSHNFFNYSHSILLLMLWVLPINLPVLVVWVHNLAVHWLTPFTSHHNVLSVMPFILLVETLTSGMMVPRSTSALRKWATNLIFFLFAMYAAVYGMTYAYRLHHAANLCALWLVILHFSPRLDGLAGTSVTSGSNANRKGSEVGRGDGE